MTYMERISGLDASQREIQSSAGTLQRKLGGDGWSFTLHLELGEPRILGRYHMAAHKGAVEFAIRRGKVEVIDIGGYTYNWKDAQSVLAQSLACELPSTAG